jgi:hypothetical protein
MNNSVSIAPLEQSAENENSEAKRKTRVKRLLNALLVVGDENARYVE